MHSDGQSGATPAGRAAASAAGKRVRRAGRSRRPGLVDVGRLRHAVLPECRPTHILDPRTGYSPTELASVSVLAPTAMLADALSTACFVLGVDASLAWIRSQPGVDAFLVLKDGETICTGGFPLRTAGRAA